MNLDKYNYFSHGGVDPASPVAAQVEAAAKAPGAYPKFSQIPPKPTDVRSIAAWRSAAQGVIADGRQTSAEARAYPFTLGDSDVWAAQQRAKIPPAEQTAPTQDSSKSSENYAKKARERATPPSASQ